MLTKNLEGEGPTGEVIGAAIYVQRELGPGLIERAYQAALAYELAARGHRVKTEHACQVIYRGIVVAQHRLDLIALVHGLPIVVECKHWRGDESLSRALAWLGSGLRVSGLRVGLLLNFGTVPLFVRRVLMPAPITPPPALFPPPVAP
jgi:GxxExxY protein